MRTLLFAAVLSLAACSGPTKGDYEEQLGDNVPGSGDGKTDETRQVKKKMERLVTILKGGSDMLDLPLRARDYELPFEDATTRTVGVVPCEDLAEVVKPKLAELVKEYSGEDDLGGDLSYLMENDVKIAVQTFGARDYFAKTLIDRRVRKEVEDILQYADRVYRIGMYDDGSEIVGVEYVAIEFRALDKAVVYQLEYSEVY
jgi:hypothetical protein